jgi:DNA polymerase elongation subunit (family B)
LAKKEKVPVKGSNDDIRAIPVFKRLFFDIETSPNVVFSWNVGYKLNIDPGSIIQERAIICICYKWEHENDVHYLSWDKGDDEQMIADFAPIINAADEVIGHNGDNYDIKWFRTRCLFHGIIITPDLQSIDTLKLSRKGFRFNSNKLDYIAQFLGLGKKMDTGGFKLWRNIVLDNCKESMSTMIEYCIKDVILLEKVFNKLKAYTKDKTNLAIYYGHDKCNCPSCASGHVISNGVRVSATGTKKRRMHCQGCGKYFTISDKVYRDSKEETLD